MTKIAGEGMGLFCSGVADHVCHGGSIQYCRHSLSWPRRGADGKPVGSEPPELPAGSFGHFPASIEICAPIEPDATAASTSTFLG